MNDEHADIVVVKRGENYEIRSSKMGPAGTILTPAALRYLKKQHKVCVLFEPIG
jgi:hypothetical protein